MANSRLITYGLACGLGFLLSPSLTSAAPRNEVLFSFNGANGSNPSDLAVDSGGVMYGTTQQGGASKNCGGGNCGTIFRLIPPAADGLPWTHEVLYSFQGGADGALPDSRPILDANGNLFGITYYGGNAAYGTGRSQGGGSGVVWELSPPQIAGGPWTYQVLYTFNGQLPPRGTDTGPIDGVNPSGRLVRDDAGNLYGTTVRGGLGSHYEGLIYRISPPAKAGLNWTETIIHNFQHGDGTGGFPLLLTGHQSVLLDLASAGWPERFLNDTVLTAVKLRTAGPEVGVRARFVAQQYGVGTPIETQSGGLFFSSFATGPGGSGQVIQLKSAGPGKPWTGAVLYNFTQAAGFGHSPNGPLVATAGGSLFGTTLGSYGGGGVDGSHGLQGSVYRLDPPAAGQTLWTYTELHEFDGANGTSGRPDGTFPQGQLAFGRHHQLYGVTQFDGRYNKGTVFMQVWQ